MVITRDPTYLTLLRNGTCAVRESIPVRMLQITTQIVNAFDVKVTYAQPYSRTTYANNGKFDAVPTSILNISYASYSRGNFTLEKALRKQRKSMRRAQVRF